MASQPHANPAVLFHEIYYRFGHVRATLDLVTNSPERISQNHVEALQRSECAWNT